MGQPFDVSPPGQPGLDVIDQYGNLTIAGALTIGTTASVAVAPGPGLPPAGKLVLYSPDGSTLAVVTPAGAVAPVALSPLGAAHANYGLAMATTDVTLAPTGYTATNGNVTFVLASPAASKTITKLGCNVVTAGSGATGTNVMAIFSEAGAQLGITGDMSTALTSGGYQTGTLTSAVNLVAGLNYYLAFLCHFTSAPQIAGTANAAANLPPINGHYPSVFTTGNTNMPASFTPSSATQNSAAYFFTAQ